MHLPVLPIRSRHHRTCLHVAICALALWLTGCAAWQPSATLPASFTQPLTAAGIPVSAVGVEVREVTSGRTLLSHQAAQAFQPASIMKLVTTEAALDLLGPQHRWITRVYTNGVQQGEVLEGDLIIAGSGDPRLAHEDLWRMQRQLRALGIREIRGALVLDRQRYQPLPADTLTIDGLPDRAYNALPDALLLDGKSLQLSFIPQPDAARIAVFAEPPLAGFTIVPPAAVQDECTDLRTQLAPRLDAQALQFAGGYPLACGRRTLALHLHTLDHAAYFDAVFRQLWQELGGSIAAPMREARVPADARELLQWPSRPLAQVIHDINKHSNNAMARNLLQTLAAAPDGAPAIATAGAARVRQWLQAQGIRTEGLVIDNGSGLSREERLSAQTLAEVLALAWQRPTMPEFMASLPVAGLDGTMRRRATALPVRANAHIKTGSLAGVASMAGYVTAKSGRRVLVVCMVNHPNAAEAREAFDQLLQWVYERG